MNMRAECTCTFDTDPNPNCSLHGPVNLSDPAWPPVVYDANIASVVHGMGDTTEKVMQEKIKEILQLKSDYIDMLNERDAARKEVERLQTAIRNHRDQKGDDRCWLDDAELYKVLPEGPQPLNQVPPEAEFLANCARYHKSRTVPEEYKPVTALAEELAEESALRDGMRELLTGVANGLKGQPEDLCMHDWSDLPDLALRTAELVVAYRDRLRNYDLFDDPCIDAGKGKGKLYLDEGTNDQMDAAVKLWHDNWDRDS